MSNQMYVPYLEFYKVLARYLKKASSSSAFLLNLNLSP